MSWLLVAGPFAVIAVYLAVGVRLLSRSLAQRGGIRAQLVAIVALGPGEIFRQAWRPALFLLVGAVLLFVGIGDYVEWVAYEAAPGCSTSAVTDCRADREVRVVGTETQNTKSGRQTVVHFSSQYGSATFWASNVPAASVPEGASVTVEVWRGKVTAMTVGGITHPSFALVSDAWNVIGAGLAIVLFALTWLLVDVALASAEPSVGPFGQVFVSPVARRSALYILLSLFGALLVVFAFAYVALELRAFDVANVLAGIYLGGAVLTLPVLIAVFGSWLYRAYVNVRALGLRSRHSGWFVAAATFIPPLSFYLPYRLVREVVERTDAPVSTGVLVSWWACAIGWFGLTIVGLTIGSPDPRDTSPLNELSNAMLFTSCLVGLFGVWLTLKLVRAIDSTESEMSRQPA